MTRVIHTIGDSHSLYGWRDIPNIQIHHLGPKLCYSVGRDGIDISNGSNINNGDVVVFCFGEIDCRCHVHKHLTDSVDYKQVIDHIVEKYFEKIKIAVSAFDNLKIAVYNVVPSIEKFPWTGEDVWYPFLGTNEERKIYVRYFNEKLRQTCETYNFVFFDVFDKYTDANGYLDPKIIAEGVHIGNPIHIQEFLNTHFQDS